MIFGNLSGLVNGTEQVVFDSEVTGSAVSSISTGNILNGDEDGWYTVIVRAIASTTTASAWGIRWNNDSGSNYGDRAIYAGSTTYGDDSHVNASSMRFGDSSTANYHCFAVIRMYAKSGSVRMANIVCATDITGTTVTYLYARSCVWNNTSDNITNATFVGTTNFAVGSRVIILKTNNFTNGTPTGIITTPYIKGAWVRIASQTLGSPTNLVNFNSLDGERDVLYYGSYRTKGNGAITCGTRVNNVTTNSYGRQALYGNSTNVAGYRDTAYPYLHHEYHGSASGEYGQHNVLIWAKSGFVRPCLSSSLVGVNGTTVYETAVCGSVYNDTSTAVSSLNVYTGSNNFDTGSIFELYALRPNG